VTVAGKLEDLSMTNLMPAFQRQSDGTPIPLWHDETDPRWLIASFLRSDIGFSRAIADEILKGLASVLAGHLKAWRYEGNCFCLQANRVECSIELCDSDIPPHIKPVCLPSIELQEIMNCWINHISSS
jgi:hypothetical protein